MASLTKIFGRAKMTYKGVDHQPPISECCVDRKLMPRWRGPQVMEDDRLAMGYVCHACGREFLPSDVQDRRLVRGGDHASVPSAAQVTHAEQPSHEETPESLEAELDADESEAEAPAEDSEAVEETESEETESEEDEAKA